MAGDDMRVDSEPQHSQPVFQRVLPHRDVPHDIEQVNPLFRPGSPRQPYNHPDLATSIPNGSARRRRLAGCDDAASLPPLSPQQRAPLRLQSRRLQTIGARRYHKVGYQGRRL